MPDTLTPTHTAPTLLTDPFEITFGPAQRAVNLLSAIARDPDAAPRYRTAAAHVIDDWRASLASPDQLALAQELLPINDDLELDSAGVCVSMGGDPGFFIQTWSWVPCPIEGDDEL